MITLIEALNYRSLKYVSQPLANFHILVGANASGKSNFLDVIAFLGRLVSSDLGVAIDERSYTQNFADLVWGRPTLESSLNFELAIEALIPAKRRVNSAYDTIRYQVSIGIADGKLAILDERIWLKTSQNLVKSDVQPTTLLSSQTTSNYLVLSKDKNGVTQFYPEESSVSSNFSSIKFGFATHKSGLSELPEDQSLFPAATWLKDLLTKGIQFISLNSQVLATPNLVYDRSNNGDRRLDLVSLFVSLQKDSKSQFKDWLKHVRTALPDLKGIKVMKRPEEGKHYLMLVYKNGLQIPSWMASDGTLRLLALTILVYAPNPKAIYMIEEPENGIHPLAIETIFHSLISAYHSQILLATHSTAIVNLAEPNQLLCFAKTDEGATIIISGEQHPILKEWDGEVVLGDFFASGVLS